MTILLIFFNVNIIKFISNFLDEKICRMDSALFSLFQYAKVYPLSA